MRLTICGDICPEENSAFWKAKDKSALFNDVLEEFSNSDRVIVNLECSLTERDTPIEKFGPNLKASPICADVLREVGVTDCVISNNHIFDFSYEGVYDTLMALKNANLNYTGFGENYEDSRRNLIIEKDGKSVAIIAVCEHEYCYALKDRKGARPFCPFDTLDDIRKAKKENDFVIVLYHGGKEQSLYPSPRLRKQSQAMVKSGADVVLCQHSHCIGCYEKFENAHILYGQGNFHFVDEGMKEHPHWQSGLIVHLDIKDKIDIDFVPVKVTLPGIEKAKLEEKERILLAFKEQSEKLLTDEWISLWQDFCKEKKEEYIKTIADAYTGEIKHNEKFAHYLYCEAHKDVWDELCKLSWETREKP